MDSVYTEDYVDQIDTSKKEVTDEKHQHTVGDA